MIIFSNATGLVQRNRSFKAVYVGDEEMADLKGNKYTLIYEEAHTAMRR